MSRGSRVAGVAAALPPHQGAFVLLVAGEICPPGGSAGLCQSRDRSGSGAGPRGIRPEDGSGKKLLNPGGCEPNKCPSGRFLSETPTPCSGDRHRRQRNEQQLNERQQVWELFALRVVNA